MVPIDKDDEFQVRFSRCAQVREKFASQNIKTPKGIAKRFEVVVGRELVVNGISSDRNEAIDAGESNRNNIDSDANRNCDDNSEQVGDTCDENRAGEADRSAEEDANEQGRCCQVFTIRCID